MPKLFLSSTYPRYETVALLHKPRFRLPRAKEMWWVFTRPFIWDRGLASTPDPANWLKPFPDCELESDYRFARQILVLVASGGTTELLK